MARLAKYFNLEAGDYPGRATPLAESAAGMEAVWDAIVAKHDLQKNPLGRIASWWHFDLDLGRMIENFADMSKSRDLSFLSYQNTVQSFYDAFDRLRREKIVP